MKAWTAILMSVYCLSGFASDISPQKERALIAYMKVKPGSESQYLELATDVVEKSRKEPGNLLYQLHHSEKNPQLFVFYERFKTEQDLLDHRNAPHLKKFLELTKPITLEFSLEQYVPLEFEEAFSCENVEPFKGDSPKVLKLSVSSDTSIRIQPIDGDPMKIAFFKKELNSKFYNREGNVRPAHSPNPWYDEVFDSTVSRVELEGTRLTLWYDTEGSRVPRFYECKK